MGVRLKCTGIAVGIALITMSGLATEQPAGAAPSGMVWVPSGEFAMGTDDSQSFPNERPAHRVKVDGFCMDRHDVTNDEFKKLQTPPVMSPLLRKNRTGRK